jgi:hypothetical protein
MQKRLYVFFNFFAFNLLFFALYLNFIHKDVQVILPTLPQSKSAQITVPTVTKSVARVKALEEKTNKKTPAVEKQNQAVKLSMN